MRGYTLVSQNIRRLILDGAIKVPETNFRLLEESDASGKKKGWFESDSLEGRVQPGSFEPSLGDELFIIDTEGGGLFRPRRNESIYRTLLQIPARKRIRADTSGGFEVKRGYSALIHLNEKINSQGIDGAFDFIKSSPKSSTGRLFPITRLMCDYNDSFDEISRFNGEMDMWLLFQPIPKDLIVHPGLTLNQLRFAKGDAKMTNEEIRAELEKNPLLYDKNGNPIRNINVTDGLPITLDLEGRATEGVIGLRVRRNPYPIDLSKKSAYVPEEHFEPVLAKERIVLKPGNHYLFASAQVLKIPSHLNAELRRHSHEGFEGRFHDAGFIDPSFCGDLVSESSPNEELTLEGSEIPVSRLDLFRNFGIPDKLYGQEGIGSNYQGQTGPKTSKHFRQFDFAMAAKNFDRLSKMVLVQDANVLFRHRKIREGFEFVSEAESRELFCDINGGFFHSRYDCEFDPLVLQLIPYVVFFDQKENVFSYVRSDNIQYYGDKRLFGKHSIGVGGHVIKTDGPNYIAKCLEREALMEEAKIIGNYTPPKFVGTLFARDKEVDNVHFGLIYAIHTDGKVVPKEDSITIGEMVPIEKLKSGYPENVETETWSRILIPNLRQIYEISRQNL